MPSQGLVSEFSNILEGLERDTYIDIYHGCSYCCVVWGDNHPSAKRALQLSVLVDAVLAKECRSYYRPLVTN